ncbi:MAG: hypothetical protein GC131_00080 [Alphaproteobacteria bacterium]|nr:hypothetical protein [Alphaproteobacteria bacterium]
MPQVFLSTRRAVRGFTMIEAAIVLGIVGLVFSTVWVVASNVFEANRVAQASRQLVHISEKMRALVGQRGIPVGTSNPGLTLALCDLGVFMPDMVESCNPGTGALNIPHVWGGQVTIESASRSSHYYIRYDNVPKSSCVRFATGNSVSPQEIGMISFSTSSGTETNAQLTPTRAAELCVDNGYMRFEMQLGYDAS